MCMCIFNVDYVVRLPPRFSYPRTFGKITFSLSPSVCVDVLKCQKYSFGIPDYLCVWDVQAVKPFAANLCRGIIANDLEGGWK